MVFDQHISVNSIIITFLIPLEYIFLKKSLYALYVVFFIRYVCPRGDNVE